MTTDASAVSIRAATSNDQPAIYTLILSNNLNPLDLDWRRFSVAVTGVDDVIGCGQVRSHGAVDELASLAVKKDWQGRGVANSIMQDLLLRSRRPLWLVCESSLLPLYQRYGFDEVQDPTALPTYFQMGYWPLRMTLGIWLMSRGTHVAYMVLRNGANHA